VITRSQLQRAEETQRRVVCQITSDIVHAEEHLSMLKDRQRSAVRELEGIVSALRDAEKKGGR